MKKLLNATGTVVLLLLIAAVLPLTLPRLFGFRLYHVLTESMEPAIPVHSIIYVKPCPGGAVASGDVITFSLGSGTELVETHRAVSVDAAAQEITTRGDANAESDQNKVLFRSVIGKVVFHIPQLGLLADWLHSQRGTALCVAAFAAVTLMFIAADRLQSRRKTP